MYRRRSAAVAVALLILAGVLGATAEAAAAATLPSAPTALTVTVGHTGLAELHWIAPASDGGSPLLNYVVVTTPATSCVLGTANAPYAECSVSYGVNYTFSVAAHTAVGTGPTSNEATAKPTPMFSVSNASVVEGNSGTKQLPFVVSLDGASAEPVQVFYETADRTAAAATDYVGTFGLLTFSPGQVTQTVNITVKGDTLFENNETFAFSLFAPTNAVLRRSVATGTIVNDDAMPSISISDTSQLERSTGLYRPFTFKVSLSTFSGAITYVHWSTSDGTAKSPQDYRAKSGVLKIPANLLSGVVTVSVLADHLHEANETFFVHLNTVTGATIARGVATGTILDDD